METKYKIHFSYIISILVLIIIILMTVKWSDNYELIQYISFASTITSLLLAVLAIVYAYLSNSTFSKNINIINDVSNELRANSKRLSNISATINRDIKLLPKSIEGMGRKVEELPAKLISQLSPNIDVMKEGSDSSSRDDQEALSFADVYLETSSFAGLLGLYALSLAFDEQKPFDLERMSEEIEVLDEDYVYGYLTASRAAGVFTYKSSKQVWNILSMNDEVKVGLKDALLKRGSEVHEDLKEEGIESSYLKDIELVEKYMED